MAGGSPWTEEEKQHLMDVGVQSFLLGSDRSFHSARIMYGRLRAEGVAAGSEPSLPTVTGKTARPRLDADSIRREAEETFADAMRSDSLRKNQRIEFAHGPIAIFFVGDQHIGNPGTDVARMYREQEEMLETPGGYVILTGDLVDNYIVSKLQMENAKDELSVQKQWALAKDYVSRFGDRLIGVNSGNHDQWSTKLSGIDYAQQITPDDVLYDADEIRATVTIGGSRSVNLWVRHKGRGSSIYNITHAQERAARFDSSQPDVFVGAHIHQGAVAREFILDGKRKLAMMSSSYKVYDGYQRQEGFASNDASTAVALVIEDDGSFWGTSNLGAARKYLTAVYG